MSEYNAMIEVPLSVCVDMGSFDTLFIFQKFKDTYVQNYMAVDAQNFLAASW